MASALLLVILTLFCLPGWAEKNKEVYATEALRGLPAYFSYLFKQPHFLKSLKPEELEQAQLIRNLLLEYEDLRSPEGGGYIKPFPLKIEFSDDQEFFRLHPDEPIRSAKTDTDKFAKIYFNTLKLNDPDNRFLDVVSIMIHEVGHKLAERKNQRAINSLAAKVISQLKHFYFEQSAPGYSIQILSLPLEYQHIRSAHDLNLDEIHFFVETPDQLQRIPYSLNRHFQGQLNLLPFTMSPEGSGNFLTNQTVLVRNVILGPTEKPLDMNLVVEIQSRWMYMDPMTTLIPGPVINGQISFSPHNQQVDLIPVRTSTIHTPVYAVFNFMNELAFNFINFNQYKWIPPHYQGNLKILNQSIISDSAEYLVIELEVAADENLNSLALDVTSDISDPYSYLVFGTPSPDHRSFTFEIPKNRVPAKDGLVKSLMVNGSWQVTLPEVIDLPSSLPVTDSKTELKAGALSLLDNGESRPYRRTEKMEVSDIPLTLQFPLNFKPAQVRLRWINGVEVFFQNENNPKSHLGRLSNVEEEVVSDFNYDGATLTISSVAVHQPKSTELLSKKFLSQEDQGFRELKEILLTSEDGRMIHWTLSSNQMIYNEEYLKVPVSACASAILK